MSRTLIDNIIRQLNEIENGSQWFDQCFKDKIGHLSEEDVFTRPIAEVHSVAEHVSHMLEWRRECIRRFNGDKTELMHSADDWKENDQLRESGWDKLKNALYNSRVELIGLFDEKDDSYLLTRFRDTEYNFHYLIEGIIQHDLYHLGQIGVTIRLLKK